MVSANPTTDTLPAVDEETPEMEEQAVPAQIVRESVPAAPKVKRKTSEASRVRAANLHARKLHAIATRRAAAAKMEKAEFIAEIVKGNYRPITAADIANEPTPAATA